MQFNEVKSDTLNLRVAPSFKATLKAVADAEHRSMVNMLEVLLADYCDQREAIKSRTTNDPTDRGMVKHSSSAKQGFTCKPLED